MRLQEHEPVGIEGRIQLLRGLMAKNIRDPVMRQLALNVTHNCPWRDGNCELAAIWHWMCRNIRYTGDPYGYDTFQSAQRTAQFRGGDCFPIGTRVLHKGEGELRVEQLRPGDWIWGRNRWSRVEAVWDKGVLPVSEISFIWYAKTGTERRFRLTADHKVFVVDAKGAVHRRFVMQLEPGMRLLRSPSSIHPIQDATSLPSSDPYAFVGWVPLCAGEESVPIVAVKHAVETTPCFDLTTDDHYVYLIDPDVNVSQCDDGSQLLATLAHNNGFPTKLRITKNPGSTSWNHIYSLVGLPKINPRQWLHMDWTLGYQRMGAPPPMGSFVEFDAQHVVYSPREIAVGSAAGW